MSTQSTQGEGFQGLRVVAFESRFGSSMERLIANHGGVPSIAPALREIPLEENTAAFDFARSLLSGEIDMVIFLTGVGARTLARVIETKFDQEQFVSALSRVTTVARGPKPDAALRDLGVRASVLVPEPNTWRELLAAVDEHLQNVGLEGRRIAVQEYGTPNQELMDALGSRGAVVQRVPVYQWALPFDTAPLRKAIAAIVAGEIEVALFTTSMQVRHLMQLADEGSQKGELSRALGRMVVASIGPTTSATLREEYGLEGDIEATHPKMAILVREAALYSREMLLRKGGKFR